MCGAVRYEVHGPLREILICHCHECRRWAGRAWAATAATATDLTIAGDVAWRPSPLSEYQADRGNCARCGSCLFWRAAYGPRVSIGAGSLDDPSGLRIAAHIWVEQGADWDAPPDDLPAYPRGYPDDAPALGWQANQLEENMTDSGASVGTSAAELISARIAELGDWRGETLSRMRKLIKEADPDVVEEWKWVKPTKPGTPVWSHDGIICTGESYTDKVKLTFAKGASLKDPARLFNSSLDGNVRRAIDIREGEKVDGSAFKALVREAVALNSAGKSKSSKGSRA